MTNHSVLKSFAKDNKGSALLSVLIAMSFVVVLGTALLYAAYCGLQVSAMTRSDKANFYDASAAMDQIKAGVQDEVSSALKEAYTETLVAYGKNELVDPQQVFTAAFLTELNNLDAFTVEYDPTTVALKLKKENLEGFASPKNGETLSLSGYNDDEVFIAIKEEDKFSIEAIELSCISSEGYESRISTDLMIAIPKFFTGSAISSGIGEYAIIANTGIKSESMNANNIITGGVYAGLGGISVGVYNELNNTSVCGNLTLTGGKVVTSGNISLADHLSGSGKTELKITPSSYDIWANEIKVGKNAELSLDGNTYIADDLVIGGGASVDIKGRYFGFGYHDAATPERTDSKSSSIFVNSYESGKKASLDLSGLDQLTLAGVSFININKDKNGNINDSIVTGESIAAKPDQLAYLVPAEAIKNYKTNPSVLKEDEGKNIIAPKINTAAVLWTIDGKNKTLADYIGNNDDYGEIVTYYIQGEDKVGYVFINFTNQIKANKYFKDYFTAKPDAIKQYLDIYIDLNKYEPKMAEITKGNTYRSTEAAENRSWENVLGSSVFSDSQARYYESMYERLSASPMEEYVNMDKLSELGKETTLKFKSDGKTVALVSGGDVYYNSSKYPDNNIKIIIAAGDVTVSKPFNGIIIAGGTVTVNASVSYEVPSAEVLTAVYKAESGDIKFSDYINEKMFNGEQSTSENEWSPDKLVYYKNWNKN